MMRALLIDDEEDARESLALLLNKFCPDIELLAKCTSPEEGLEAIATHRPELLFLDVQMPRMSGFDLLEKVSPRDFQVIFVSAHDQYAIKAIRFSALDFLLKPVDVDELLSAIERFDTGSKQLEDRYAGVLHNVRHRLGQDGKLAIPTMDGMEFVQIKDIVYCSADGSYTQIHFHDGQHMLVSKTLKEFESILDPAVYCRVHHGSIINLQHVERYVKGDGGYVIMSNGAHVDISRRKKEEFMKWIAKL